MITDFEHRVEQDPTFRRVVVGSTALALAAMLGSMASIRISRETGLQFQLNWTVAIWSIAGAMYAWYFWRLAWAAQAEKTPRSKARLRRFVCLLFVMGAGAFIYPIRFVAFEYLSGIVRGLITAVIFLGLTGWQLFRFVRTLEDADRKRAEEVG